MANPRDTPPLWLKCLAYGLIVSFSLLFAFMLVTADSAVSLVKSDPIGYIGTTAVLVSAGITWSMFWSWWRRSMRKNAPYDWGPIAYAALGLFVLFGVERAAASHDFLACALVPERVTVHDLQYRTSYFPVRGGAGGVTEFDGFYVYRGRRVSVTLSARAKSTLENRPVTYTYTSSGETRPTTKIEGSDFTTTLPRYGAHFTCGASVLREVAGVGLGVLTFSRATAILRRRRGWLPDETAGRGKRSGGYTG